MCVTLSHSRLQPRTGTAYFEPLVVSRPMDPLLETNRKKKSKYQLKFYKDPQTIKKPRTEKDHRYVKYRSKPLGGVSATQSSIKTTVIDEGKDDVTPGVAELDEENLWNEWNEAGDNEPLDQAYLNHISEGVVDERQKRERPKGVSHKVYAT